MRSKLSRYFRGLNPLEWVQVPVLTKTLDIAYKAQDIAEQALEVAQHAQDKAQKALDMARKTQDIAQKAQNMDIAEKAVYRKKAADAEYKHILLSREGRDHVITRVNREKLDSCWFLRGLSMRKNQGGDFVDDFEELAESTLYYLRDVWNGEPINEGDERVLDCVTAILRGLVPIDDEDFRGSTTTMVGFQFDLYPPLVAREEAAAAEGGKNCSFPIRFDALLVSGETWLLVASQHKLQREEEQANMEED